MRHGLVEVAVEPRSEEDRERLRSALVELTGDDPGLSFDIDHESGQFVLAGAGETALDAAVETLKTVHGLGINVGAPQVGYRETITRHAEIDTTYARPPNFARVRIVFEPGEPGSGFVFESAVAGGAVPDEYIAGVRRGLEAAKDHGLLAGFPLIDVKATLIDGAFHDVDSSVLAFELAARAAFKELREKGGPKLLEPIMNVEVVTPEEYLGSVIGDLNSRRGQIQAQDISGDATMLKAFVPLSNMFGYSYSLRGMSQGRAQFTMQFEHYAAVPLHPGRGPDDFAPDVGMRLTA